jgi:SAM-dependent methyltransferase
MNPILDVNNDYRWKVCPLCHSAEIIYVGNIDYRKPTMFSTNQIGLEKIPELFECNVCNSAFTQNIVQEKVAHEMYSKGSSADKWPRNAGLAKEKHANIIKRLNQYFLEGKRVLDVGCNTGILLDHARARGCVTYGIEPSSASLEVLRNKGHIAFPSMAGTSEKFDVITAFDLVEHLYDLPGFLSRTCELLADGGALIILTGDIHSLTARLSKEHWWYLKAPEHIVFPSIRYLNGVPGFKLVSVDKTYASVGYEQPYLGGLLRYVKCVLLRKFYIGLPSLGPDHVLVTLNKADSRPI